jgi:hypothetical protein
MENLGKHLQGGLAFTENDVGSHITDCFRPIAQEVSMKGANTVQIRPVSMSQTGPWDFQILQKGEQYIQANHTRCYMKLQIKNVNGNDITEAEGVGICNMLPNSLIKTIEIEVGGKPIPELQNTHANYKSYLETLLSYDDEAKQGHLNLSMYRTDTAGHFDDVTYCGNVKDYDTENLGLRYRRKMIPQSDKFEVMFPLHCDFLNSERLLPPGIDLTIKLTRESDDFVLMVPSQTFTATAATGSTAASKTAAVANTKKYKIHIEDLKLYVRYVTVADNIFSNHRTKIQSSPMLLPIKKTEFLTHNAGQNTTNIVLDNLFLNKVPSSLMVMMVDTESYNGKLHKNPYNFQHYKLNFLNLTLNGKHILTEPYTPDWEKKFYIKPLRDFFDNVGIRANNIGNISPALWAAGCTIFAFDLSPDLCNGYHWHKREHGGSMCLEMRFAEGLPRGVTILMYAVYDALVAIDKDMNVAVSM